MINKTKIHTKWILNKFKCNNELYRLARDGVQTEKLIENFKEDYEGRKSIEGNIPLNEGINAIWTLVCGGAETPFDHDHACLGVGNGTQSASAVQTGLTGAEISYKNVDAGYPSFGVDQKAIFRATFGVSDANFEWNEWSVCNACDNTGKNINRKVETLGAKTSGKIWIFEVEMEIS